MTHQISKIRFICKGHNMPLTNCGNGRVLSPTCSPEPDIDDEGWLSLDTSEMSCPGCNADYDQGIETDQDWVIEAQ